MSVADQSKECDQRNEANLNNRSSLRWKWMWISLAIGAVLETIVSILFRENLTYLAFISVFIILPDTLLNLLLWWTFGAGVSWQTRLRGWLVILAAIGLLLATFRFDEFDGAMIPRFVPRWSVTGRDRADQYFRKRNVATLTTGSETDKLLPVADRALDSSFLSAEYDSPSFRGANRDAVVAGVPLASEWGQSPPKALWRHPIGLGWGGFSVIGRRAWTIEQRGPNEVVACYDVETGLEIWIHADPVRLMSVQGGDGPRSTPTLHEGRVYSQGATGILNCLDGVSGKKFWSVNTVELAGGENLPWGQACSPLIVDDLVIVSPGSNDEAAKAKKSAVMAFNKMTGEKVWSAEDRFGSYVSPHFAMLGGEAVVLIFDGPGALGLNPKTGERLWSFDWQNTTQINGSQPLLIDDHTVLFGSGYGLGSVLLDITNSDKKWQIKSLWQSKQFKLKFNGAVRLGDHLYGLDEGLLTCVNVKNGKRLWKQGRYGFGQMLLVEDTLLILSEEGDVVLVPATPQTPRERARFHAIDGKTWNHPVLVPGRLLVRNAEEAACFEVK